MSNATWQVGTPAPLVLLDLDGTLCDSAGAITAAMAVALDEHGVPALDEATLRSFVGPPFAVALTGIGLDDAIVPDVVATYRRHYGERFMLTSPLFDGVEAMLRDLHGDGVTLVVATSKPQPTARRIVEHLGVAQWLTGGLDGVFGADTTRPGDSKADVIGRALAALGRGPAADVVMVGDRVHDVEGAGAQGISTIGVAWGYAADGELADAGALVVAQAPAQVVEWVRARAT